MGPNPPPSSDVFLGAIPAYKAALVVNTDAGGLAFSGVGYGGTYGAHDVATCVTISEHVPPHAGCGCGFYAWRDRDAAVKIINDETVVILDVELWGSFHEYELGFVAAAQRVGKVTLQPFCAGCLATRDQQFRPATMLAGDRRSGSHVQPMCDEHAGREELTRDLAAVSESLGVDVDWAADDDPVTVAARELAYYRLTLRPRPVRRLDDLLPYETGYVFQNALAEDRDGSLYMNAIARLIQPLPGTDVPIRIADDGVHEVLLDGIRDFNGWGARRDAARFPLRVRAVGRPTSCADAA